jgi:hypothetical protein
MSFLYPTTELGHPHFNQIPCLKLSSNHIQQLEAHMNYSHYRRNLRSLTVFLRPFIGVPFESFLSDISNPKLLSRSGRSRVLVGRIHSQGGHSRFY